MVKSYYFNENSKGKNNASSAALLLLLIFLSFVGLIVFIHWYSDMQEEQQRSYEEQYKNEAPYTGPDKAYYGKGTE